MRKGEGHRFPHDCVDLVILARKLRNRQMTVLLPNRSLGPRAAEGRTRRLADYYLRVPIIRKLMEETDTEEDLRLLFALCRNGKAAGLEEGFTGVIEGKRFDYAAAAIAGVSPRLVSCNCSNV